MHGGRGHHGQRGPWWAGWEDVWAGAPQGPGRRMRRGDIRAALLRELAEGPAHGYELINRLEERSGGVWRPSPGSVYPTLQLLEDEGLVRSEERDSKRVYELTEEGRTEVSERAGRAKGAPWEEWVREGLGKMDGLRGLRQAGEKIGPLVAPLAMAVRQVAMGADPAQLDRVASVVRKATSDIYRILSEDRAAQGDEGGQAKP